MTKIIVTGATGRMGSRITALSKDYHDLRLVGAVERKGHEAAGKDIGPIVGIAETNVKLTDALENIIDACDVIIDFTSIGSTLQHLKAAAGKNKAMVIGTTGFSKEELEPIKEASKNIPIVLAPNMSVGVNLLLKVLQDVAKTLGDDYDIEIVETHHRLKKDAPSGTAMKMAQVIADAVNRNLDEVGVYARKGLIGERTKKEIGIQTLRGGDVVGEHTVFFYGLGERVEITHKASSRDTFARGALKAALWISGRKPGLYDMQDVLGLK
ncbi:MAG: 4-hydroxy-tetrahydrodipicolinate reductase [Nitrospirae bacterium GWB2_47_37]|nr:MAG: 4-hydroxy-tetrahydrodipicolinate reductase [Nitrospirae bacterium GWB2_47_37]HAK88745.1 4-hydroxy-tetrahydrodipicolinate reductase [Nitrospiraceae bacterium]